MKLEYPVYRDKVMGCWAGKNVGGVLGAPFECKRQFNGNAADGAVIRAFARALGSK